LSGVRENETVTFENGLPYNAAETAGIFLYNNLSYRTFIDVILNQTSTKKEWVLYVVDGDIKICAAQKDYSSYNNLTITGIDDAFIDLYKQDLQNCIENPNNRILTEGDIQPILQKLQSNARTNQRIEFSNNGIAYKLENGILQINDMTDADINTGNWTDATIDNLIRYTINSDGIIQVKAFGFRGNLGLAAGKTANLSELSTHVKEQTNKFLLQYNVNDFEKIAPLFENDNEVFADGKKIEIGGNNSTFFKIIHEGIGITTTLLKTGEIEDRVYLKSTENTATIHAPGLVSGSFEAVAQKVTDITSLGSLAYDLAVDEEVRTQTYEQFKEIKTQIGNDPENFVPIFVDVIVTVTTGNSADEWKATLDEKADTGERTHLATRGTGNAVMTVMAGVAIVKDLPEIAEKLAENIRKAKKIIVNFKDLPTKGFVNPKAIRFSQNSISSNFRDGSSIEDLIRKLKNKEIDTSSIPPIRIVEKDGLIYTLDNRRLKAFQDAGIDIPYEKLDNIPENEMFKFTTNNEGVTIEIRGGFNGND
jgi:hypothetical protein